MIGNSHYTSAPYLPNPQFDAAAVADALRKVGAQTVTLENDLTRDRMIAALHKFDELASRSEWAVVYYAGHGIKIEGVNYLDSGRRATGRRPACAG